MGRMVLKFVAPGFLVLWLASTAYDFLKSRGFVSALRVIDAAGEIVAILAWMAVGAMVYARWTQERYDSVIALGFLFVFLAADRLRKRAKEGEPVRSDNVG